jgi:peptidoglycan/xylan/chitin deacetylase (PgdA/CDA1 family)
MKNILSIDLESFVHINPDNKDSSKVRKQKDNEYIIKVTEYLLIQLKKHNQKATFFTVAEIYNWYPELIKKIQKQGHEVAFHTFSHKKLKNKDILEKELKDSKKFIKELKPKGFRAPQIYFKKDYFRVLERYNFKYDSSSYGGKVKKYNNILEIPVTTYNTNNKKSFPRALSIKLMLREPPVGCGFLIGLLGESLFPIIKRLNKNNKPYIMFIHPWQIRKFNLTLTNIIKDPIMLIYFKNRRKFFEKLVKKFEFTSFEEYIKENKLL